MKLYHPTLPDVTVDADTKSAINAWIDQGWRKTPPKQADEPAA